MNEAHLHLMVNHLPLVGLIFALGVTAFAFFTRKADLTRFGLWLIVIASLSAIPAYFTGEGAEEVVEHVPGISENLIEDHEEMAEVGFILTQLTGVIALASALLTRRSENHLRLASTITMVASVGTLVYLGMVSNSGGKINHPELRDGTSPERENGEDQSEYDEYEEHEGDDD